MISPNSPVFFSAKLPLYGHARVCALPLPGAFIRAERGLHPAVKQQPQCRPFLIAAKKKRNRSSHKRKSGLMDFRSVHTAPP